MHMVQIKGNSELLQQLLKDPELYAKVGWGQVFVPCLLAAYWGARPSVWLV